MVPVEVRVLLDRASATGMAIGVAPGIASQAPAHSVRSNVRRPARSRASRYERNRRLKGYT